MTEVVLSLSRGGSEAAPQAVVVEHGDGGDRHDGDESSAIAK